MIRRHVGNEVFLITQNDHAALSGQFAQHWGNRRFARPQPCQLTITAASMHDAGWPLHDHEPTLNPAGKPLDVFESPRPIALKVWSASADRAESADPYAGLLVSLHVLALSAFATSQTQIKTEKFDTRDAIEVFELNKFQHKEIERQERLRRQLGLRIDIALTYGLAEPGMDYNEDQLLFNFRLLQAMDLLSLCACCTLPPSALIPNVLRKPAARAGQLSVGRMNDLDMTVQPWPFDGSRLRFAIPYRRLPDRAWENQQHFREAYQMAPIEQLSISVYSA